MTVLAICAHAQSVSSRPAKEASTVLSCDCLFMYSYSCKNFNNLNSFFAITIGLMDGAITRLKQTWKEVPPRLRTRFEQFQGLTVSRLI